MSSPLICYTDETHSPIDKVQQMAHDHDSQNRKNTIAVMLSPNVPVSSLPGKTQPPCLRPNIYFNTMNIRLSIHLYTYITKQISITNYKLICVETRFEGFGKS